LKITGNILATVIMPQTQSLSHLSPESIKVFPDSLADRFQGFEPGRDGRGMDTDTFQGTMIDSKEDVGLSFCQGHRRGQICAPHVVNTVRYDGAIMMAWARVPAPTMRRQESVLPQQPQDPPFRGANASITQSCPNLTITLSRERRVSQHDPDVLHQHPIRIGSKGTRALPGTIRLPSPPTLRIKGRTGQPPDLTDSTQRIDFMGGGRGSPAYFLDLRHRKGRPASRRSTFWWRSSHSMVTSPKFSLSWGISASFLSPGSFLREAWPPCRNFSLHWENWAAVTPNSRESNSNSSPRSRRKTMAAFFLLEGKNRCLGGLARPIANRPPGACR
jgi:hypothetical protein